MALTRRQREIYDFICSFVDEHGYSPSLEEIGGHFGGRDHSTVLHAERSVEELLNTQDQPTEQALAVLTRRLMAKR